MRGDSSVAEKIDNQLTASSLDFAAAITRTFFTICLHPQARQK
jgi:CBS-domain-containing membrane protein